MKLTAVQNRVMLINFCDLIADSEIKKSKTKKDSELDIKDLLKNNRALIIITPTVNRLYGSSLRSFFSGLSVTWLELALLEGTKTIDSVSQIASTALEFGLGRIEYVIAIGGGVCTDVSGLAAALIRRGVPFIRIPTTFIGQIDASVGLKNAINFGSKKNYLGTFYGADYVFVDIAFLQSLSHMQLRHGLSEAIKMAFVRDRDLFERIEKHGPKIVHGHFQNNWHVIEKIVYASSGLMVDELNRNPYENMGFERLVDFGHTFSPLLEERSNFTLPHGDAVSIDMAFCWVLSHCMGIAKEQDAKRAVRSLRSITLPVFCKNLDLELCQAALWAAANHRGGALNLPLPVEIEKVVFINESDQIEQNKLLLALKILKAWADEDLKPD